MSEKNKRIIGVVSGKGGVGKTTIAVNTAVLLSMNGIRTMLIDSDLYNPSMGFHLGMWHQEIGLQHFLENTAKIDEVISIYNYTGLRVILSSLNYYGETKTSNFQQLVKKIEELKYDYIIFDSPPGLSKVVEDLLKVCTQIFVVLTPDIPSMVGAKKVINLAAKNEIEINFILNRVTNSKYEIYPKEIEEALGNKISTIVPEDVHVPASISARTPITLSYPMCEASGQFELLAKKITGLPAIKNFYSTGKKSGFSDPIRRFFGL